jgi:SnoaL-like domain
MTMEAQDRAAIRELVDNWAVWRDSNQWDKFRTVWHDDGRMVATWAQGTADEFIARSKQAFANGMRVVHSLGGCSVEVNGSRAIAQTKMTISQRAAVHDVLCDVVCTGRFYDFLEKREGRWGIVLRQPIYEKDRIDPVDPSAKLNLDQASLAKFPEGYRHLAYIQSQMGFSTKMDMPQLTGPEVEALYLRGEHWLAGEKLGA